MGDYGRQRRRTEGAVYELLTVDTSGDDAEVGNHGGPKERGEDHLVAVAKPKGKRRKQKSRKMPSVEGVVEEDRGGGSGEVRSSLEIVSLGSQRSTGLVIGPAGDVLSIRDLIDPRRDDILADWRLERRNIVKEIGALDFGDVFKNGESKDTAQESPFESVAAAEVTSVSPRDPGEKSRPNTESLRNFATGFPSPRLPANDYLLLKSDSMKVLSSPVQRALTLNLGNEIRPGFVPFLDTNTVENASIDGRVPDLRLMSPKDRLSGRTSPVATSINSISDYSPRGGSRREPLFTSAPLSAELRQRSVEKSPESPVQENGRDGSANPTTARIASLKKQKPDADSSYLGHVDVIEQSPGYRIPALPRPPLSTHETPHLTEWERLMAANSERKCLVLSGKAIDRV